MPVTTTVEALYASPAFLYFITAILGLCIGSFLNVVVYRLPLTLQKEWQSDCCSLLEIEPPENTSRHQVFNLLFPNSHCPHCDHNIRLWENIPVLSYLILKGKCSGCSQAISLRYPLVEFTTGALSVLVVYLMGFTLQSGLALVLTWALISLTLIDFDTQLLPDNITLPLLWLGLIANYYGVYTSLENALWGAIAGYLSLWSIFWLFKLITGKEGMGYGDFKLLAALGAWMGWQALPQIIILSSFVGAAIGIGGILVMGRDKNLPIPFGPYLAIAGWIALLWGEEISLWYLQFSGLV